MGAAVRESGIPRKELSITTKVWIQEAGYEKTKKAFEASLSRLGLDTLDLYLIHMPYGDYHGSWRAMEELYRDGRIKAIGVCNFEADRLVDLILSHEVMPAVNQIEMHPFCQQRELRKVMEMYDIRTMAWAPFAEGRNGIFQNDTLAAVGSVYHKTPAQVILRWLIQEGIAVIPKSVHRERIEENFMVDDFQLADAEMEKIRDMDTRDTMILAIRSQDEVCRLHEIRFEQ